MLAIADFRTRYARVEAGSSSRIGAICRSDQCRAYRGTNRGTNTETPTRFLQATGRQVSAFDPCRRTSRVFHFKLGVAVAVHGALRYDERLGGPLGRPA